MYRRLAMVAAAILCIAPMPTVGCAQDALPPPPLVTREGDHFRVLCHFDTERLADETLAAVEGVWDSAHALLPGTPADADLRDDTWIQLAFGSNNAIAWHTRPVGNSRYAIQGTFEILHSASPQLNLLLGRSGNDFVSLAFRADFGVTIFGYRSATDTWTRIGNLETPAVKRGARVPFEVSVSGSKLTVRIAGEDPLSWKVEGHDLSGPWGVGAQAGGAGTWRDVTLR